MFGLLKSCHLDKSQKGAWTSHYCGLCVSLSQNFGDIFRVFTNSEGVLVSLLCEAQSTERLKVSDHRCLLRRRRKTSIVSPNSVFSKYAAVVSSLIASSKIVDQVVDRDSLVKYFPKWFCKIAFDINYKALRLSSDINVDTAVINDQMLNQIRVEKETGRDFLYYSRPVETASSFAYLATAELTGNPQNRENLSMVGRMYGRIIYLLDSYRDYSADLKRKKFNPLAQTIRESEIHSTATAIFDEAYARLKTYLSNVELVRPELCLSLLGYQLGAVASGVLSVAPSAHFKTANLNPETPGLDESKKESWCSWCDCGCCECDCCCESCGSCDCPCDC